MKPRLEARSDDRGRHRRPVTPEEGERYERVIGFLSLFLNLRPDFALAISKAFDCGCAVAPNASFATNMRG